MSGHIRIAITAESEKRRRALKKAVEKRATAFQVVACTALTEDFVKQINQNLADVLLVDMVEDNEPPGHLIQQLLIGNMTVVFNDDVAGGNITTRALDSLIKKLDSMVSQHLAYQVNDAEPILGSQSPEQAWKEDAVQDKVPDQDEDPVWSTGLEEIVHDQETTEPFIQDTGIDFEEEMGIPVLSASDQQQPEPVLDAGDLGQGFLPEMDGDYLQPENEDLGDIPQMHAGWDDFESSQVEIGEDTVEPRLDLGSGLFQEDTSPDARETTPVITEFPVVGDVAGTHVGGVENEAFIGDAAPTSLWVLGASIGGPQAVKRFLASLPADIDVSFLLIQHIGINFVDLLAEQLERSTSFRVRQAQDHAIFERRHVLVTPADRYLDFYDDGDVRLSEKKKNTIYSPCIDDVLEEVARHYPGANCIIFSGMGDDGARGVKTIAARGGLVWAQSAESCVISSMPDCARDAGVVGYTGTPEQLAHRLIDDLKKNDLYYQGVS